MRQLSLFEEQDYWRIVLDGDPIAFAIHQRHYSARVYADGRRTRYGNRKRRLFVGPGEKLVLLGNDGRALCAWAYRTDARNAGERRVYCTVFRNESDQRASAILRDAMALAWARWPMRPLWTYIDPRKLQSEVPGYCFRRAGWRHVDTTPKGILIFRANPRESNQT